jgi:hypothetical protein
MEEMETRKNHVRSDHMIVPHFIPFSISPSLGLPWTLRGASTLDGTADESWRNGTDVELDTWDSEPQPKRKDGAASTRELEDAELLLI